MALPLAPRETRRDPAESQATSADFEFLDKNELLVSGVGLGSGICIEGDTVKIDFAYPTSGLASALVQKWWSTCGTSQSVKDDMIASFLSMHSAYKNVIISDAIQSCPVPELAYPQGYLYLSWRPGLRTRQQGEDRTKERSVSWSSDRLYMVRSMSKAFASAILLVLQDRHVLNLDDSVGKYLQEYEVGELKGITIRMLLCHTSGLPHFMAQVGDESPRALTDHTITLRESAAEISNIPLISSPGAEFHYTELGYQVAGAVAEVASKKLWHQLFQDCLEIPLGLQNTSWHNTYVPIQWPDNPLVAVGIVTDCRDLQVLIEMFMNKGKHVDHVSGEIRQVLSENAVQQIFERQDLGDTSKDVIFKQNGNLQAAASTLEKAGILSSGDVDCVSDSWNRVGYGLGAWLGETGNGDKHAFFLGAYNGIVSVLGTNRPSPLCTLLMTYAKSNVSHAVLSGLAWRQCSKEK